MAHDRIEQALGLAKRIDSLRQKVKEAQGELQRAEAEFATLIEGKSVPTVTARPDPIASNLPGSLASRVMKVFEAEPSRVFTLAEVAKAIGADSPNQLSSTMNRLKDQRRLRRAGWGKYELYVHEAPPQRGRSVA